MKKIKVGAIGLGYWGPNLVRNFYAHPGFEVKYACDLIDKNLEKINKSFPTINLTKNFEDLLKDEEIKIIAIATPPETHYKLGEKILLAKKHLWVEKPFTTSYHDAKKLIEIADKKNLYIHVDLPFLFYPPVEKIKNLVDNEVIGKPYYFTSLRTNLGLIQKEVDVVWDLAPHDLSIIFYLFPKLNIKSVKIFGSSHLTNHYKPQIATIIIYFIEGLVAYIYLSWLSPVKIRLIKIGGSKKMILFDDINPTEKIKIYDKSVKIEKNEITPFNPIYREGDVLIPYIENKEALYNQVDYLYSFFSGKNKKIIDTKNIALSILKIISNK